MKKQQSSVGQNSCSRPGNEGNTYSCSNDETYLELHAGDSLPSPPGSYMSNISSSSSFWSVGSGAECDNSLNGNLNEDNDKGQERHDSSVTGVQPYTRVKQESRNGNDLHDKVLRNILQPTPPSSISSKHSMKTKIIDEPEKAKRISMCSDDAIKGGGVPRKRHQSENGNIKNDQPETKKQSTESISRIYPTSIRNPGYPWDVPIVQVSVHHNYLHDMGMGRQKQNDQKQNGNKVPENNTITDVDWSLFDKYLNAVRNWYLPKNFKPNGSPMFPNMSFADTDMKKPFTNRRHIVIDGSNVAMSHGEFGEAIGTKKFSTQGILICLEYFVQRGHEVKVIIPEYRRREFDSTTIQEYEKNYQIVCTPCGKLDGKRFSCYDDRYILQYATVMNGIVVSNDRFRDLYDENVDWQDTIDTKVLRFKWDSKKSLTFWPIRIGNTWSDLEAFLRFI